MVTNSKHIVSNAERIDSRYYLIEIGGRYFIIDYSNPKDFRNYLVPFYPEIMTEWTIYDVTGDEKKFEKSRMWSFFEIFKKFSILLFIFFLINSLLFPAYLNITSWTYDIDISRNWFSWLVYISFGVVFIVLFFNLTNKKTIKLTDYRIAKLEKVQKMEQLPKYKKILRGMILILLAYPILLLIGIFGNNYAQLIMFGFVAVYTLIFIKFIEFQPTMGKQKYYIKEE